MDYAVEIQILKMHRVLRTDACSELLMGGRMKGALKQINTASI